MFRLSGWQSSSSAELPEAIFLVMGDPSMNEL